MGELLKNARLSLGLSQKEMAAEVMSVTQYSRIEKDQQRIRFDDLVKILHAHQIDIASFINQFLLKRQLTDCNHDYYLQKIESMYWERDLSSIDELLDKLKQFGQHGLLNLLTKLLIVNVKDVLDCPMAQQCRQELCQRLLAVDKWTDDNNLLILFAYGVFILDSKHLDYFAKQLFERYQRIDGMPIKKLEILAIIAVNYLANDLHKGRGSHSVEAVDFLYSLPAHPHFLLYKLLAKYYKAVALENVEQQKKIARMLVEFGYRDLIVAFSTAP